jgi:tetratricopeptide (TPR) repeat protein
MDQPRQALVAAEGDSVRLITSLGHPVRSLLTLTVLAGGPLAAADVNKRTLDGIQPVRLETVLANPNSLQFAEVRFRATFAAVTDLFDFHRTNFRPERFVAIAIWSDRAKLWIPEVRADVLTSVYIPKDRIASTRSTLFHKYEQVEIAGIVKDIVDGVPQIEVTGIKSVDEAGALTDSAVYHVEQAIALTAEGARDLADEHYAHALAQDLPVAARIDLTVMRGRTLIEAGHFDVASTVLSSGVALAAKDLELSMAARSELFALLAKAQIEQAERGGDTGIRQAAVDNARKALGFSPDNGQAYAVLGIGLAGLGQYDEARRHCDNAVRLRPADAEVRWYLGRILDQQGRTDESIDALRKAIDLTPKDWRIHKAIASAYHHRGLKGGPSAGQDLGTALREYDITLRLNPNDADVLALSGTVIEDATAAGAEIQIGSARQPATRELALARYQQSVQLDPKRVSSLRSLGVLQAVMGMGAEAKATAEKLKALGAATEAAEVEKTAPVATLAPAAATQAASSTPEATEATVVPAAEATVVPAAEGAVVPAVEADPSLPAKAEALPTGEPLPVAAP